MKVPGFAMHIHLHGLTDPEPGPPISKRSGLPINPLKLAAKEMLKEMIANDPSLLTDQIPKTSRKKVTVLPIAKTTIHMMPSFGKPSSGKK